ncbi:MAG TPA: hypothetical protein VEK84_16650 [Terriglobales bacterium]|nr:hypothetical protein [Terriglobales bacterium]
MMQTIFETMKQQRVAWSCALLVGMFLTVFGHAPVLPVAAGCILAIGMATLRARSGAGHRGSK